MPAPFEPTQEQRLTVRLHKVAGTPDDLIVRVITNPVSGKPISKKTLYRHFRDELDVGKVEVDAMATGKLIQAIRGGEAWAICFYMKAFMGKSEKPTEAVIDVDMLAQKLFSLKEQAAANV